MGLFKAKVCLKDGSKVIALLDTGAEINVMIRKLIKNTNLAMRQGLRLELVSYLEHNHLFLNFCDDLKVAIRGLKIRHPIFVIEARDHDLVLNHLFLNSVKLSQKYKPNKIFGSITHSHTH